MAAQWADDYVAAKRSFEGGLMVGSEAIGRAAAGLDELAGAVVSFLLVVVLLSCAGGSVLLLLLKYSMSAGRRRGL